MRREFDKHKEEEELIKQLKSVRSCDNVCDLLDTQVLFVVFRFCKPNWRCHCRRISLQLWPTALSCVTWRITSNRDRLEAFTFHRQQSWVETFHFLCTQMSCHVRFFFLAETHNGPMSEECRQLPRSMPKDWRRWGNYQSAFLLTFFWASIRTYKIPFLQSKNLLLAFCSSFVPPKTLSFLWTSFAQFLLPFWS